MARDIRAGEEERGLLWTVVRRPVAVLMMVLAVGVFGYVSLGRLRVSLLPDVSYPSITVRTEYEGAAPIDVEKLVTRKIEEQLAVISRLVSYRSVSRAGVSDVMLEFEWNTPMTFALQDVREKVAQLKPRLPQEVKDPLLLRYNPTLDPILRVAIFKPARGEKGPGNQLYLLRRIADEVLQRKLEVIPGVAAVRVRGGFEDEWRIELDERRLKEHGISADQVRQRVAAENVNVAGGRILDGDREILVRTVGEIANLAELGNLVVDVREGRPIRIKDVGRVVADKKERDVITRVEGTESVEIEVFKEAEDNLVDVAQAVKARLFGKDWQQVLKGGSFFPKAEHKQHQEGAGGSAHGTDGGGMGRRGGSQALIASTPRGLAYDLFDEGVRTRVLSDQSVFIRQSLDEVRNAALMGALLAVLVLFAFLRRLSPTLIIGVTIPISVLATFAPLFLSHVSLNIMSLGGLALGIGMLVDSAIVVLESISRLREEGMGALLAAVKGTRSVGMAVLASTLTTVAVFLPIVFVQGIAGEFFRDQALTVVYSLVASLLAAVLFIPMLASREFHLPADLKERGLAGSLKNLAFDLVSVQRLKEVWKRHRWPAAFLLSLPEMVRFLLEVPFRAGTLGCTAVLALAVAVVYLLFKLLGVLLKGPLWCFDFCYRALERGYARLLSGALKARLVVLLLAAGSFYVAYQRLGDLGLELVPEVHQGEFTVETQLPVGSPLAVTDRIGQEVAQAARRALKGQHIPVLGFSSSAGVSRDVIAKAGDGKHTSRVHVRLAVEKDLARVEQRAIGAIRRELADIPEVVDPLIARPSVFTTSTAMEVLVIGPRLQRITSLANRIEAGLRDLPGITDVHSTHRAGHPELVIIPDRQQMAFYGIQPGDVADLIRNKVQGVVSTRVTQGDRKVDVLVRIPEAAVNDRQKIKNLRVNPSGRRPIPLSAVARVEEHPGPAEIRRVGGERAVILSADVENLDLHGAAQQIKHLLASLQAEDPAAFQGVVVRVGGQSAESEKSLKSMLFAMAIAIFLVYVVMASQFESLLHPLVILFTIPLAMVGVIFALDWLDIKLSIVVLIGIILLAGIVVNNAIVLVDCVNQLRRNGLSRDAALSQGSLLRLRPILMTTATTVLGLLPLALGLGQGTEIRAPMAITVIAGLSVSTLLTLLVIPVVYSIVCKSGPLEKRRLTP